METITTSTEQNQTYFIDLNSETLSSSKAALRKPTDQEIKILRFWRNSTFLVMLFGYVGYYLCRQNISAAFPLLNKEFGFSNTQLGQLALLSEIAYATGKFINGPLGDRIGGRKIFLSGMLGAIAFNVPFTQFTSLLMFTVVWCCARYFLSMGWGGLAKTIGAWYEPEKNGTVMGFISLNFQFGGVIATLFAGLLVTLGVGWKGIFLYPAAVLFLIFIWSYLSSKDSPQDVVPGVEFPPGTNAALLEKTCAVDEVGSSESGTADPKKVIAGLFKMKVFKILLVYSFLTTFLRSIFFFWTPKLLVDIGMGTSTAIFKSALFPLLGCIGTVLLGWYTDRYAQQGDRADMMWKMLAGLVVCLIVISVLITRGGADNADVIALFIGLSGFFLLGPYSMSSGCLTLDIAGSKGAGSCTGMIDGFGYVGGALSVWLAGKLSDSLGWSQVFVILAVFAATSMGAAMWMSQEFRKSYRQKNQSQSI